MYLQQPIGHFQDVHFRAVQLRNESLAEKAKHIAEQISLKDELEGTCRYKCTIIITSIG